MWKRDEVDQPPQPAPGPQERTVRTEPSRPTGGASERATIGRSIAIKGEVTGEEDLLIQGRIEGSVNLKAHAVTVGSEGRVSADITARVITVEGEVVGDLRAQEQVALRSTARVHGDLTAPRVVLEDGAAFRGLVDMGEPPGQEKPGQGSKASGKPAAEPPKASRGGPEEGSTSPAGSTPEPALASSGSGKDGSGGGEKAKS